MIPLVKAADENGSDKESSKTQNLDVFLSFLYRKQQ